jgi:hypothetical protein
MNLWRFLPGHADCPISWCVYTRFTEMLYCRIWKKMNESSAAVAAAVGVWFWKLPRTMMPRLCSLFLET